MKRVFPSLAGGSFDHVRGGWVCIGHYRLLNLGYLSPQVLFAQDFSGHGMAVGGFVGEVMAECIAGTAEHFDLYARLPRRRFPAGAPCARRCGSSPCSTAACATSTAVPFRGPTSG